MGKNPHIIIYVMQSKKVLMSIMGNQYWL